MALAQEIREIRWLYGSNKSCYIICDQKGYEPFSSGEHKNGEQFYVCSANAGNEGHRSGYNLPPEWDNHCYVGYGGKEKKYRHFKCLCIIYGE